MGLNISPALNITSPLSLNAFYYLRIVTYPFGIVNMLRGMIRNGGYLSLWSIKKHSFEIPSSGCYMRLFIFSMPIYISSYRMFSSFYQIFSSFNTSTGLSLSSLLVEYSIERNTTANTLNIAIPTAVHGRVNFISDTSAFIR